MYIVIIGLGEVGRHLLRVLEEEGHDIVAIDQRPEAVRYVEEHHDVMTLRGYGASQRVLKEAGVGARTEREGLIHGGIEIAFDGRRHRIDFQDLTGGKAVTVFGQTEITKDLNQARLAAGGQIVFEAEQVSIHEIDNERPRIRYVKDGTEQELTCDFIAGCDGYHGVCRDSLPAKALKTYERTYPFAWLGILAENRPADRKGPVLVSTS